ncbi:MAG: dienelactone hydrolase family protein [Phycisphaerales bacterium]|nr:MAG: dienelactone hydrolase family protein [Phycisphaerales bacterium]
MQVNTTEEDVLVTASGVELPGLLWRPAEPCGIVIFAHGSGSSRLSSRNQAVARWLVERGCATLLFDLLTDEEAADRRNVFDIPLLGERVVETTKWLKARPDAESMPIGYFGASTGAAAALVAAAELREQIAAVISRGGRPDLAIPDLPRVTAPTLLIVGSRDDVVLDLNKKAQQHLSCDNSLVVVPGATHLFEEPGTLEQVGQHAGDWFTTHFT